MTTACTSCLTAESNPMTGLQTAFCRGCEIRAISNAPRFLREQMLEAISDPSERDQIRAAAGAEYRRRKALVAGRVEA